MRIPFENEGMPRDNVIAALETMRATDADWRGGRVPLYVFTGPREAHDIGQAAYNLFFTENALGARRAFPSLARMEQEVVGMGLDLLHAPDDACGNMTSGGTESIVMAVKACRDRSRARSGNPTLRGNLVLPETAHPAFDKAAALMDLPVRRIPAAADYRADIAAMAAAIDSDTILLVGSAPGFSFGVFDDFEALSDLALARDIWLHADACVGGWMAPFAAEIGRPIPQFDFALPGVLSLSGDLHKFGFCPKPASVVFYRTEELQAFQAMDMDVWPSGRFATQTLVGTRPGGAVAAAWAVLRHLGREGFRKAAHDVLAMRDAYIQSLTEIPGMTIRGRPELANIAFGCDDTDMAQVATLMGERGWIPGMVRRPPSLHLMLSLHHDKAQDAYVRDLAACIATVRAGSTAARTSAAYA